MNRFIFSLLKLPRLKPLHSRPAWAILGSLLLSCSLSVAWAQLSPNAVRKNILITNTVKTEQVTAALSLYAPSGLEDKSSSAKAWLVLTLQHAPGWHTYWKNPGDAGLATQLTWAAPPGIEVGPALWPEPERIALGDLINFGYTGISSLIAPLRLNKTLQALGSPPVVKLHASWLVCRQECIPQEGDFEINLLTPPIPNATQLVVQDVLRSQPQELSLGAKQSRAQAVEGKTPLKLEITGLPKALKGHMLDVFPEQAELLKTQKIEDIKKAQQWVDDTWVFNAPVSELRAESPQEWSLVLLDLEASPQSTKRFRVVVHMNSPWPTTPTVPTAPSFADPASGNEQALDAKANAFQAQSTNTPSATTTTDTFSHLSLTALALALASAFLGGLILNLMPCVLPVLAIKALSFIPKEDQSEHQTPHLAVFYALGIWLTLLALGGLILLLRAGGAQLGWGFQLQSPLFVVFLSVLFTLIALNLWGVFEVAQAVPSFLSNLGSQKPWLESFLSGALSVLIASPCTAPFMGASIGLAFSIPTWQGMMLFSALALGLAFPILAIGFFPKAVRLIPKPGAWMLTFRASLGFPMALTVLWLTWVLAQQVGIHAMVTQLMLLLFLSACAWCFGLGHQSPSSGSHGSTKVAGLMLILWMALEVSWGFWVTKLSVSPTLISNSSMPSPSSEAPLVWHTWSKDRVKEELSLGHPVFVDYTAAWCLSCQFNKVTFERASVQNAFKMHGVRLFQADWTRQDPLITQSLNEMGRNGVPVYVLYGKEGTPRFLSEFVTEEEILGALASL